MKTLEEINKMFKETGSEAYKRLKDEVKELTNVILDDELITYSASGYIENKRYLIVSTDKRLLLLHKEIFVGIQHIEIHLNKINSILYKKGLIFGSVEIWDSSSKVQVTMIPKLYIQPLVEIINKYKNMINSKNEIKQTLNNTKNSTQLTSAVDEVLKLKELLDSNIITQEEFDKKKKELLNL